MRVLISFVLIQINPTGYFSISRRSLISTAKHGGNGTGYGWSVLMKLAALARPDTDYYVPQRSPPIRYAQPDGGDVIRDLAVPATVDVAPTSFVMTIYASTISGSGLVTELRLRFDAPIFFLYSRALR